MEEEMTLKEEIQDVLEMYGYSNIEGGILAAVEYIEMVREDQEYSVAQWFHDTRKNYSEMLIK